MSQRLLVSVRGEAFSEDFQFPISERVEIGRDQGCSIRLSGRGISRKHASVQVTPEGLLVSDSSVNGIRVNGLEVRSATRLSTVSPTRIELCDFSIRVVLDPVAAVAPAPLSPEKAPPQRPRVNLAQRLPSPLPSPRLSLSPVPVPGNLPNKEAPFPSHPSSGGTTVEVRRKVQRALLEHLDLQSLDRAHMDDAIMRPKVLAGLRRIIAQLDDAERGTTSLPEAEQLVQELADEALGLGPLEVLLADVDVNEIMVVDPHTIFVERSGKMELSGLRFTDDDAVRAVIERIVTPLGRRIDESTPLVDARLKDGSRVNAVIPPLALKGPCITIRKFAKDPIRMPDLIGFGSVSEQMGTFLENAVKVRRNIVISGGTGSGKTTLLNVLSAAIPSRERVVTVEDAAELQMAQPHVVSLESRPPNLEGKGEYSIRDLVKNALRMRPDRIVVGECRGGEALDMLQAMNTGHEGSLTTTHANSPREAVSRIETLCLMAGLELPIRAIRQQIASSIHLIVQQTRFSDGARRVQSIAEVVGIDDDGEVELREIYSFKPATNEFLPTGYLPSFVDKFIDEGLTTGDGIL